MTDAGRAEANRVAVKSGRKQFDGFVAVQVAHVMVHSGAYNS
jgi:hypothetical protein